jgi:ribosomal protein L37AE/L43A
MMRPIKRMAGNPICTCCGSAALFQNRDGHGVFYCPSCARFAAEKTAESALKALLVMLKANSFQKN